MITTAEEYLNSLWAINDGNTPSRAVLLPSDEIIYNINLDTRVIETPSVLSVQGDHVAETIYFLVDRMFGDTDLANTTCVIQYINANDKEGFQIVPFYDVSTFSSYVTNEYVLAYVTEDTYHPNKYYIYQGEDNYVLANGPFEKNTNYYLFNDTSLNKRYIKANVTEQNYHPGSFYYFNNSTLTYEISNSEFDINETYYLNIEKRVIKANVEYSNYKRNTYYILNKSNELELATGEFSKNQEYYSVIDKPKILFPWKISADVAAAAGIIKYSIRFFKCNSEKHTIIYDLNTKVAQSRILEGMQVSLEDEDFESELDMSPTKLEEIYNLINENKKDLVWLEVI